MYVGVQVCGQCVLFIGGESLYIINKEENKLSSTNKTQNLELNQWVLSDSFNMADFNEDNAKVDAAAGSVPTVKLMDVTLQEQAGTVELNLSGIDLTKYLSLRLYQRSQYTDINLRVNKISEPYSFRNSSGNWQKTGKQCCSPMGYIDIELNIKALYIHSNYTIYKAPLSIPPESMVSLDLIRDPNNSGNGTWLYPVGTRFILIGVKK